MAWLLVAAVALCAAAPAHAAGQGKELVFGVFPRWNAPFTVRDFTPLAHELSRELGRPVRVETDKDFDSFMRRVYAGEFDIVHLNQLQYLQAHRVAHYRAIAKICNDSACTIRAIIVVRRDAHFKTIADLRGKTIAFGDPGAMVSYVLAKSVLAKSRLRPGEYKTIFTKNPPNALLAVYNGEADAAGVGPAALQQPEILRRIDVHQLMILAESRPIPHLPVAVRGDMDRGLALRIQRILTGLANHADGRKILADIGIERFETANDRQYRVVKELMEGPDR
ncbi:MAG: phosphate/phosphite/phosphonate ABC transporter substrate-binding protein [Sulfuricaulis sp.]